MIATLRRRLIAAPARLISHGRQLIMRLAPSSTCYRTSWPPSAPCPRANRGFGRGGARVAGLWRAGRGIRNTGMSPWSVMGTSAAWASRAALRSAGE
jgi:hypothetical protein